ncbi:MAG: AAA domain-containing protein, partial [Saprospiraceae bacterium]
AHEQSIIRSDTEAKYLELGMYISRKLLKEIFGLNIPKEHMVLAPALVIFFKKNKQKIIGFKSLIETVVYEVDEVKKLLLFYDEDDPEIPKKASYDVHDKNEIFNQNVLSIQRSFKLPVHVNFIDTEIRDDLTYVPKGLIIHPDHLVDVTSISECFKDHGSEPLLYLISKFKPAEASVPLLIGNLVNFILDELISDPQVSFKSLLPRMFHTSPLSFAMLDDSTLVQVIEKLKEHFKNLKLAVIQEFGNFDIRREQIFLEPSFYSRDYGIQGRLDLLHQNVSKSSYDIIELKSGKTFRPNVYGINANHYIQTLLYDLIITSTFDTRIKSFAYILYSKESNRPLRFAPPVRAQQYEAMKLRNDIVAIEYTLRSADKDNNIFKYIKPENFPKTKGFNAKDIDHFYQVYIALDDTEKSYFDHFCAFIAREHGLSKTGEHGINKSNGHAAMWTESDDEKRDRFALLSDLVIIHNASMEADAEITLKRKKDDDTLVNFRIGDIGILYPKSENGPIKKVVKNQIFKCSIIEISPEFVKIQLRNKQYNQSLFRTVVEWNIEQDHLDSGFNSMYKNIFGWATAPKEFRTLVLGRRPPQHASSISMDLPITDMTESQSKLLSKMIACKDYFLLWGPPGTGKTSVMLKHLVHQLYERTNENILLLAYTNRAVDEICDAIISISDEYGDRFLRLGSRVSTDPKYKSHLIDQVIKKATSRQEIIDLLAEKRIFISTVSSIVNRVELFHLKEFDTIIIDEASQILEPMLVGFLSRAKRFILIGDHKQLPAVVVQEGWMSKFEAERLHNIGIYNGRTSLFERLIMQVKSHGWDHAMGVLEQQGRMHQQLMEFPNLHFYEEKLKLLPGLERQYKPSFFDRTENGCDYLEKRTVFINTSEDDDGNWKTNIDEANACKDTIIDLLRLYDLNHKTLMPESIGIITPYRAQIALIRKVLQQSISSEILDKITIDTVERYQGGARDIILISFCVNRWSQMQNLVSLSHEGIDRKLNVALTRAREQNILIGNQSLLRAEPIYSLLIDHYTAADGMLS